LPPKQQRLGKLEDVEINNIGTAPRSKPDTDDFIQESKAYQQQKRQKGWFGFVKP
jgi:hypothetical protein